MNEAGSFDIDFQKNLIKDGPKFLSHTLIIKEHKAYLKPTISAMLFCVVYIVVGLFLISLASYVYYESAKLDLAIFLGGFGIAIGTFGISLIQPFLKNASFDKSTGQFENSSDRNVKLARIVSLQINNKVVLRKQALNYNCFELNMLTKSGRRINIINHNNLPQLTADAKKLADFLQVELSDHCRQITL